MRRFAGGNWTGAPFGKLRSVGDRIQLEMSLLEADQPGASARIVASGDGQVEELFDLVGGFGRHLRDALAVPQLEEAPRSLSTSAWCCKDSA